MFILRVDDRLVHGQVIAGWARPLAIDSLIIASDKISQDEWTCNAYRLAVPEEIKFLCFDLKTCVRYLDGETGKRRTMAVVEKVLDAFLLVENGLQVKEINIGGLSFTEGSRSIAPYINLSVEDIQAAVKLYERGIKLIGKQLPNSPPIDIMTKLAGVATA